jgi:hypothetical protein
MVKRQRLTKKEMLERIFHEYMIEFNTNEVDPDHLTDWAIKTKRMKEGEIDFFLKCKKELTKAMRGERRVDPQGREVPKMIGIRAKKQKSLWIDMFEALPRKMRVALSQQRRMMVAWCRKHQQTTDSYNDNNKHGAHVETSDYNFNKDLKERQMPLEYPDDKPEGED